MKVKASFFCLLSLVLLAACGFQSTDGSQEGQQQNKKKVTIMLDWVPNTNHTGLYVAEEKGYFAEEGLDVDIVTPGKSSAIQIVGAGKAEFGISSEEYITQARASGIPVLSIAAILQHNTSGFASPQKEHITQPKDLIGKTYGGWGTPMENAFIKTVLKADGIKVENVEDKVNIVNIGKADFFTATKRDIDFSWVYYGWTGVEAKQRDYPINMIYLKDLSPVLDYYTPTIITSEQMASDHPETVKKFMKAVSKGYQFAVEHPEKAADILIEATPESDAKLIRASQKWMSPRYQGDAKQWGIQKKEVWVNFTDWMFDHKLIEKKIKVDEAFTNKFLPEK